MDWMNRTDREPIESQITAGYTNTGNELTSK